MKMEEDTQHVWCFMLNYFKKDKSTAETPKKNCAVYEEGSVID